MGVVRRREAALGYLPAFIWSHICAVAASCTALFMRRRAICSSYCQNQSERFSGMPSGENSPSSAQARIGLAASSPDIITNPPPGLLKT